MSTVDWRASLSFSDRLASITRIQVAFQSKASPESAQETLTRAKATENEAYRNSASKNIYDVQITSHIKRAEALPLQGTALQSAGLKHDIDCIMDGGIAIGNYANATHYSDGLFSTVYRARPQEHGPATDARRISDIVALKVTQPSTMSAPHDSKREARILALASSQRVIPLLDSFSDRDSRFVMAFPFLQYDLSQILRRGPLPAQQAKSILSDLMGALSHIHSLGIIHRDIKPSNILMRDPLSPALLADFGIAWMKGDLASEEADQKILDVGTTCYRPPELLFGNSRYNESLDIWAAGCVAAQVIELGSRTLFDSGDLGSDLALIKSIFETLGTPDLSVWPEVGGFPDWGKMAFHEYPPKQWTNVLPDAVDEARDFVVKLVRYESGTRMTPSEALEHPFLMA
ncbi:hypothetical protein ANO11243_046820 [Dothideomycetidae sp. 11243]|nr:hypothetical protein ANO11243_046820 [fungal sp. No.11243]